MSVTQLFSFSEYSVPTYLPKDVPTDAKAANTPRRCGCDTSAVYTLDGAPIMPELRPAKNLPT